MAVEFLIDRDIGRHQVPNALRERGFVTRTLFDVYREEELFVSDVTWLRDAGTHGWAVITADAHIRRRRHELAAVETGGVKVFTMPHGNLTGPQQVNRVLDNLDAVLQACTYPGGAVFTLLRDRIERRFP